MTIERCTSLRALVTLIAALSACFISGNVHADAQHSIVFTDRGPVRGVATGDGRQFLGIPYAAPPVGELRWRPPQTTASWAQPRDASEFGSNCPQNTPFTRPSSDENCLFLNVYTPHEGLAHGAPCSAPVMVFIHGGSFRFGEGSAYDPTLLVRRGVVVVTINYRLGALGFLAHPALTAESPDGASGNYGLMDQQEALRWVQRNIAQFGGDTNNVTIFGESAGAISVLAQLASTEAADLFQRAIVQSFAYLGNDVPRSVAETQGSTLETALGCSDLACLRAVPVSMLLAAEDPQELAYRPDIDGKLLTQAIGSALASGDFSRVPVILGTTHDEARYSVAFNFDLQPGAGPVTAEQYPAAVAAGGAFPAQIVSAIVQQYSLSDYASPGLALAAVGTDSIFACPALTVTNWLRQYVPTWTYEFNDPDAPAALPPPVSFPWGAYHGSELQYLFPRPQNTAAPPLDAAQQQLSDTMVRYWTQFARFGNPNGPGTPLWIRYLPPISEHMQALVPPRPHTETATAFATFHQCDFWTAIAEQL